MSDKIKELAEEIKKLSKTDNYSIKIIEEEPQLYESKIGGIPYWTPDLTYPLNSEGKKLFLLAQINFEQEKTESPLPNNGLLQFFTGDDDEKGLNFDDMTKQENFRIVYHENIDYTITKESVKQFDISDLKNQEYFPICGEYKISLSKSVDYANPSDIRFNKFFSTAFKKIYGKELKEGENMFNVLNNEERAELEHEFETDGFKHKMLGYSYFIQEDPREDEKYADYDTLLLQIDSEGEYTSWDCGIGNFFINKKALFEKDFSKVLFYWDSS